MGAAANAAQAINASRRSSGSKRVDSGVEPTSVKMRRNGMTYEEYNAFCRELPAASYVVQWGGSHVWKVGDKVFAIGGWHDEEPSFTFKVNDIAYEMLKGQRGLRPAPYLASRGMKWIQHFARPGLSDDELRDYIRQSHFIVSQGLSKKKRIELGLVTP